MRWDGAVAVITGASRGIGREVARAAAARGARVGLIARSSDDLDRVLAECGGTGAVATADVGDRAEVEAAIAGLERTLGPTDVLIANAGIGAYGRVTATGVEAFERMIRVNYLGTVYATKAVLPGMIARGRGHVVMLVSIAGRIGAPLEAGYSGSKFAIAGLADALSLELEGSGVGVTIVNPGPVATAFFDARGAPYARKRPRPVTPERVAAEVIAAVEKGRREVFIPRWLRFPAALKAVLPGMFRAGTLRDFREDLRRH